MKGEAISDLEQSTQDQQISAFIEGERARLRSFISKRITDQLDLEDILQDVFYELVEAYRLMKPIERAGAWMFRVAQNRITDLFRKKKPEPLDQLGFSSEDGSLLSLEDMLPSTDAGPEAAYTRSVLIEELEDALGELTEEQRFVFVAHEIEGRSFASLAAETGQNVNTLLSRKHAAVRSLRQRLQSVYEDFLR